jgi:tight adherence protein B
VAILLVLIFLAVSLGLLATAFVWSDLSRHDQTRGVQRLGEECRKPGDDFPREELFRKLQDFDLTPPVAPLDDDLLDAPFPRPPSRPALPRRSASLRDLLQEADLLGFLSPRSFLLLSLGLALAAGVAGFLVQHWYLALPGFVMGGLAPWMYVSRCVRARRERLLRQLPPAFDLMARVLRAGLSMPQAFQGVAESFEDPIAGEFIRCREEQNLGVFPEISFHNLAERTRVLEMKLFVRAMLIQKQTGGNLSEVLERLAAMIRDRLRLRNQIRILTAEGRMQALVLLLLPGVMFLVMRVINRPYADLLLEYPSVLMGTGALMAVGALWIRRIIRID